MSEFGVKCRMASGEYVLVTVEADSAADAHRQVRRSKSLFFGGGDPAGRWLAARAPNTVIVDVSAEVVAL